MRVLIVEDEPLMAGAIRDGLRLEAIAAGGAPSSRRSHMGRVSDQPSSIRTKSVEATATSGVQAVGPRVVR
jgi:hypothetical protein